MCSISFLPLKRKFGGFRTLDFQVIAIRYCSKPLCAGYKKSTYMKLPYVKNSKQTGAHFSKPVHSGSPAEALQGEGGYFVVGCW